MNPKNKKASIAVACYPTIGGSGIIATEIAYALAKRGYDVHLFSYAEPTRLRNALSEGIQNLSFHQVNVADYPVFHHPPYTLALASKIVEVAKRSPLALIHVHYALPHAAAALLARQALALELPEEGLPKIVTTLHGTDITLIGQDPAYKSITRWGIMSSDAVTVPSKALRDTTLESFNIDKDIEVIPNFVDSTLYAPTKKPHEGLRLIHVSNFRPVKRIQDLISIFHLISQTSDARLALVGDGPELPEAMRRLEELQLMDRCEVYCAQDDVSNLLQKSDVFIMPSAQESFGVAALEALSCGVPVVASRVGGLPEVIRHGQTGYLCELGDVHDFANKTLKLLDDKGLREKMGKHAREDALERFQTKRMIDLYEALYKRVLEAHQGF